MTVVHDGPRLRVAVFTGGVFQENTFLLTCLATGAEAVVDPGAGVLDLLAGRAGQGGDDRGPGGALRDPGSHADPHSDAARSDLVGIWLTHAHLDHVEGIPLLREALGPLPVSLHPADLPLYRRAPDQARAFGVPWHGALPEPDHALAEGQVLSLGALRFDVRFAPGHAPGHVLFVEAGEGVALVGDVIFQRSIGRTDLPGGDTQTLLASIRREVLSLPDETLLLPGHGPPTTVGEERRGNPFLMPQTGHPGSRLA